MTSDTAMDADELAQSLEQVADNLPVLSILDHGFQRIAYVHVVGPPPTPLPDVPEHCRIVYHVAACPRLASVNCACGCAPLIQRPFGIIDATPRKPTPERQRHNTLTPAQRSENARRSWARRRARANG